jgi:hypothetical protein
LKIQSISNLNFSGYSRQKNRVQTRKKIRFLKLDMYFNLENVKNQVQTDRGYVSSGGNLSGGGGGVKTSRGKPLRVKDNQWG